MMTTVSADQLFDGACQRQSFAKRRSPAHLHDQARDPARGRFLTEFTKQASQFLFAVLIYNLTSSQLGSRVHAHVERTISNEAKTAMRILELAGRNTKIKECASDGTEARSSRTLAACRKFACRTIRRRPKCASRS